jgi:xylan 1,4-beta-xylosidase
MKKGTILFLLFHLALGAKAQAPADGVDQGAGFYSNPIFAGDYPDPSILRDGENYYIVHSSFEYYPGLLIWRSTDLIHWTPVTDALHRYVGSVWAPDLTKCRNKYCIYFPAGSTNYVVTADSIQGPWSDPVDLKIGNIDPGHVVDPGGKRYLYFSSGGYVPLSDDGLSVIGDIRHVYDGWPIPREWTIECFCLEGPKLVKHGNYYYLTVAEGGTAGPATSHMIISARSKTPFGPWENSPYNPIERTGDSSEKWWSKGHGTLFEDAKGNGWIVFHGYENGYQNMGRQTLLQPVEWTKDGWFRIPEGVRTDEPVKIGLTPSSERAFSLDDAFDGKSLNPQWKFFGEYDPTRFRMLDNRLILKAKGRSVEDCSPLLCIPSDHSYAAEVELFIEGRATGGLVLFYDGAHHSGILADSVNILADLRGWQFPAEKQVIQNHVFLRLRNTDNTVDLFYSVDGAHWKKIENSLEVSALQHNALGGFLSLRIGLCSIGDGNVTFRNFRYRPIR